MGLLDKVKAQAEQAAAKAREGIEDVQTKRDLGNAYEELGRKAYGLVEAGQLQHADLSAGVERIRGLKRKLEDEEAGAAAPPA